MSRLSRLVAALLVVTSAAPAVVVCAGRERAPVAASHDCCPKDEAVVTEATPVGPGMAADCCAMSDAATPTAPPLSPVALTALDPVGSPVSHLAFVPAPVVMAPVVHPPDQHVPRYLRLSVLLV